MPITKRIVEMMNGHIEVESEKGAGTKFTVTVTLAEAAGQDEFGEEGLQGLQPHEMSVLVVDDDPVACEHARIILGQVGISCETAESGTEALKMVRVRLASLEA